MKTASASKQLSPAIGNIVRMVLLFSLLWLLVACGTDDGAFERSGPRLVSVATLAATTVVPAQAASVGQIVVTPSAVPSPTTSTIIAPTMSTLALPVVTIEGDVVLVTPTLPPSKTPTLTPTTTETPTPTRTPSATPTQTATLPILSPSLGQPTPIFSNPVSVNCPYNWFFANPLPSGCPLGPATVSSGSLLYFERGFMIWVRVQDAIYVFYNDATSPRWQVFNDAYDATMPETDPQYDVNAPPLSWQPRRGFGLIWREQTSARDRLGWAIQESETSYNVPIQASPDGTIYIGLPNSGVVSMAPNGSQWQGY
ncbi:MAG: hypothetical protein HXY40_06670 [Chloroflexi bacterium]|nr:hypothetical protein [Chloroflexota bacterium]